MRKSTMTEPDEDQERLESKRLRLVGGLDVSVATMDCVPTEEYSDLKNVNTEVENIQQWKARRLLEKIVCGMKSGEILGPLKVEKGRLRELGWMNEHNMYDVAKNADARGGSRVHAKWLQDHNGDEMPTGGNTAGHR